MKLSSSWAKGCVRRSCAHCVRSVAVCRGVGGKPKIVAKRDPSVSNSAWESIIQMNVDFHLGAQQAQEPWSRRAPLAFSQSSYGFCSKKKPCHNKKQKNLRLLKINLAHIQKKTWHTKKKTWDTNPGTQ